MNKQAISIALVVFGILYFVSPIDAVVGPVDDLVIMIATAITSAKLNKQHKQIKQEA